MLVRIEDHISALQLVSATEGKHRKDNSNAVFTSELQNVTDIINKLSRVLLEVTIVVVEGGALGSCVEVYPNPHDVCT